ncbi:Protein kinase-like domain [Cordyceps javanica]|uniref:Protein kinase-like domain n=1 Tax=Cordyceps javanica TaxID=43265 RepID=A0A545V8L5_9HYPO|nr:Protein kinase-like domain [Cordyceps javanica]TQW08767.1 Protein kinase-like domain [Cordyceps javanica]
MDLLRVLLSVWTSARSFVLAIWRRLKYRRKIVDVECSGDEFPPAPKALKEAANAFIQALQPEAIEALASHHNDGKPCKIFYRLFGSFNVCYFVQFEDGVPWTIRIPIMPRLFQPWDKVQSEVATLNYIRSQTSIPVPKVYAFGNDAILTADKTQSQIFLISEFIDGVPLMPDRLLNADAATRTAFYRQLFDYLAQLRCLEFEKPGSLTLAVTPTASVSNVRSFATNSLRLQLPSFTSAKDYILSQYKVLQHQVYSPVQDYSESDIRYELFALHTFKQFFDEFARHSEAFVDEPFVLNHPDLHLYNILVDSDMTIVGIIDWEFAHAVPLRLFTPPLWAIYQQPGLEQLSHWFCTELDAAASEEARFAQLFREWYGRAVLNEAFYLARVIRHPTELTGAFERLWARKEQGNDMEKAESEFFFSHPEVASEATRLAAQNARWTRYLHESGMQEYAE